MTAEQVRARLRAEGYPETCWTPICRGLLARRKCPATTFLAHTLDIAREGFIVIPQVGQLGVANLT